MVSCVDHLNIAEEWQLAYTHVVSSLGVGWPTAGQSEPSRQEDLMRIEGLKPRLKRVPRLCVKMQAIDFSTLSSLRALQHIKLLVKRAKGPRCIVQSGHDEHHQSTWEMVPSRPKAVGMCVQRNGWQNSPTQSQHEEKHSR